MPSELPLELWNLILQKCHLSVRIGARLVSKDWHDLIDRSIAQIIAVPTISCGDATIACEKIKSFPRLRGISLKLDCTDINDFILPNICKQLEHVILTYSRCRFGQIELKRLPPNLKTLRMKGPPGQRFQLILPSEFPANLRVIDLDNFTLGYDQYELIGSLPTSLEQLHLRRCNLAETMHLERFTFLKQLTLKWLSRFSIEALNLPQTLEHLSINTWLRDPFPELRVSHLTELRHLDCSPSNILNFDQLPISLTSLKIKHHGTPGDILRLIHLKSMDLQCTLLSSKPMPNVKHLTLRQHVNLQAFPELSHIRVGYRLSGSLPSTVEGIDLMEHGNIDIIVPSVRIIVSPRRIRIPSWIICAIYHESHQPQPNDFKDSDCLVVMSEKHFKMAKPEMIKRSVSDVAIQNLIGCRHPKHLLKMLLQSRREKTTFGDAYLMRWMKRFELDPAIAPRILRIFQ